MMMVMSKFITVLLLNVKQTLLTNQRFMYSNPWSDKDLLGWFGFKLCTSSSKESASSFCILKQKSTKNCTKVFHT